MTADLLLVLDRRDSLIRLEGQALRVERPDGALQRVPLAYSAWSSSRVPRR